MAASGEIQWPPMGSFPWPPSMSDLGEVLYGLNHFADARELQERVLAGRATLHGYRHPDTYTAKLNLSSTLWALGEIDAANKLADA
jgi:Tetratricopeptide repeat